MGVGFMAKDTWSKEADKFLRSPPIKSRFQRDVAGQREQLPLVSARRRTFSSDYGSDKNRVIHVVFAAFVDLVVESVPLDQQEYTRTQISSVLSRLNLVPKVFFTPEFTAIRQSLASVISGAIGSAFNPQVTRSLTSPQPPLPDPLKNRYLADFEELAVIGEGGFGKVYKVKSRVDGHLYAVKKIKLKKTLTTTSYMNVVNEVKVLGSLHHPNIVRYHCGWWDVDMSDSRISTEPPRKHVVQFSPVKVQEMLVQNSYVKQGFTCGKEYRQLHRLISLTDDEEDTKVGFVKYRSDTPYIQELRPESPEDSVVLGDSPEPQTESPKPIGDNPDIVEEDEDNSDAGSFASTSSDDDNKPTVAGGRFWGGASSDGDTTESREETVQSVEDTMASEQMEVERPVYLTHPFSLLPVFHIQMELCTSTLEQHLFKRNNSLLKSPTVDGVFNRDLCIQLLSAVQYIHSNHLIHRDIKPANIFLKPVGCKIRFLLGDFGLACPDLNEMIEESKEMEGRQAKPRRPRRSSCHSIGVGTTTYAAPEQLQSSDYGPLVDIYSAGVVFFEVYNCFSTAMERIKAIEQLRAQRKVPKAMEELWPTVVEAVLTMTDPKPAKRPSASQLLKKLTVEENSVVANLQEIIKSKDKRIQELEEEVARLKAEKTQG